MVAVSGYHQLLCGVQGGFVAEVGVGVVDLHDAAAGGGGDVVLGEKGHGLGPSCSWVIFT
ncbi:hypothetical protein ABZ904_49560 [Streptomyces sp. NPDC046900]|uniref:hypothetical protein n=1 Tax=Streptomyces sp. NPDC046900 TaxID=3155473 RepID=UPI0033C607A7